MSQTAKYEFPTTTIPDEARWNDGSLRVPHHKGEQYVKDYNRGWTYSLRDGGNKGLDGPDSDGRSGNDAWMDGYLDAANRDDQKWHLGWCTNHANTEGGCGRA